MKKPKLSFWQIWNMSFGFLGIQFGFALQGGFMSHIFTTLGASKDEIPMLWIFAPLAGLIVQPIIGYMSDRTWSEKYGRRKPYFLIGAIFAALALFIMPYSPYVWVAVGCLLILDSSINVSMEPFRALVADKLDESQRSYGFVIQTLIIGVGTWIASQLPKLLNSVGVANTAAEKVIPDNVKYAFAIGAAVFILSILYTIFTTTEYPPEDVAAFEQEKKETAGFANGLKEIGNNIVQMPKTMKKLGVIQFFSWFAFFTMWSMATPALTEHVFDSPKPISASYDINQRVYNAFPESDSIPIEPQEYFDTYMELTAAKLDSVEVSDSLKAILSYQGNDKLVIDTMLLDSTWAFVYAGYDQRYNDAAAQVGASMGTYGLTSMAFALLLTFITRKMRINRKFVHMFSLIVGGLGFIYMLYSVNQSDLNIAFGCIGIAWASILSMPYAMLSSSIDAKKMGVYMGLFNMFIVIPQIVAAVGGINLLYKNIFGENIINTMLLAGSCLIVAGLANFLITNKKAISYQSTEA